MSDNQTLTDAATRFRHAIIDTAAITENVAHLKSLASVGEFIAVVKADGYGHGAARAARAAIAGGATRIGVADLDEALDLVRAGLREVPVLAWLHPPGEDFRTAVDEGIELGIGTEAQLEAVAAASATVGPANVHLKLETGLGRGGAAPSTWTELFARARQFEAAGLLEVVGIFSHLSGTSAEDDLAQLKEFTRAVRLAQDAGLQPQLTHLAATAATISLPQARLNAVRVGLGIYGLSPFADRSASDLGLRAAMTLRAPVAAVRRVPSGQGVSYDYKYRASRETTLALVPLGYADGIPRQASGLGEVSIAGKRYPIAGRVAMDQFVIDVGDAPVAVGDLVTVFGDERESIPTAADWADAAGTINYEIVTRIGHRVTRVER
ncbi:alanine racemase [Gulosibacter molinativorax]|uniref:Alanine racemase n=1 Tax=Gulosibacter molinativorax TaxID=256821 RepID=A0ABT7C4A3_9MICO|nr:alanine racemase [Gulosibacter molinativorax]MDJ1370046.1 alanine racemase [Gulosibacter molinativorax]QUY63763.1 Alanine racemase [Gulosibacter molinativorax]